ncbi:glycosyltransferase [Anoxybacterium hadale]|uniref:Glycosyltransferase n=1 Tax=Anoxybacterium hadale TaxID=3408580 RepID=A0ACD1AG43_9FIRM|nr:glycosyltransferase [Clostridiales bacterium]
MKVLILGNRLFSVDMLWGFLKAGCDAQIINASNENQIQQIFSTTDADLLITLGTPIELKAEAMKVVGSSRPQHLKYIHWDTDGISSKYFASVSGDGIEMDVIYNSRPDLVLTMCPEMRELIIEKGFPCEMMHYAYSPVSHQPLPGYENDKYFINLIGNSYSMFVKSHPDHYRYHSLKILLKPLLENKYTVHLYGDSGYAATVKQILGMDVPTLTYHNYMPYERTCAAYNSSFINLVTQNHPHTITKRTFEILGSGGFALSADNEAIRKLFVPGRDLIVSSSPEETMELVHYYEKNQDEWRKIRENAVVSVENHTYKQRAEYILKLLEKYYY